MGQLNRKDTRAKRERIHTLTHVVGDRVWGNPSSRFAAVNAVGEIIEDVHDDKGGAL